MIDLLQVLIVGSLVMCFASSDPGFWVCCLVASAIGLACWPSPDERDLRRALRKREQVVRRERERLQSEIARLNQRGSRRDAGDWL
jgi:hypothetical protein